MRFIKSLLIYWRWLEGGDRRARAECCRARCDFSDSRLLLIAARGLLGCCAMEGKRKKKKNNSYIVHTHIRTASEDLVKALAVKAA